MKKVSPIAPILLICIFALGIYANSPQQTSDPLKLIQTIPLPDVNGRIDHMDVDIKGRRLFISGLENNTLEVVDLKAGKWVHSIPGLQAPQGVAYVYSLNKIFVANEKDDTLKVFRGDTLALIYTVQLDLGANRIAYDPHTKKLYVGYGGSSAKKDYGEVGIIDAVNDKHVGDIRVGLRPAEILMNKSGGTLFVFENIAGKIQVVDTKKNQILAAWPVSNQRPGDGAFDEITQRLFIGTRTPPAMIAMDSTSGREVASLPTVEGMDGVYFDAAHKRIYISGGRGFDVGSVFVYQQLDADHYTQIGKIPTRPGAGTSFWSPKLNRYFVAAPAHDNDGAAVLVFEPRP